MLTNDKDFGELAYRSGLPHAGVVLFRLQDESTANRVHMMKEVLRSCDDKLEGSFIVASERKIRMLKA
jgi:predicted nuclease of predicted toxin-antitoxin system